MKDLSYLQVFPVKVIRSARMIIAKGFTVEDINKYLENLEPIIQGNFAAVVDRRPVISKPGTKLEKPCCGGNKVDKQVEAFRERQRKLKVEKAKKSIIDSS